MKFKISSAMGFWKKYLIILKNNYPCKSVPIRVPLNKK
jgi:hypothetical protein